MLLIGAHLVAFPCIILYLIGGAVFGLVVGAVLVWVGTSIGQVLAFFMGRYPHTSWSSALAKGQKPLHFEHTMYRSLSGLGNGLCQTGSHRKLHCLILSVADSFACSLDLPQYLRGRQVQQDSHAEITWMRCFDAGSY